MRGAWIDFHKQNLEKGNQMLIICKPCYSLTTQKHLPQALCRASPHLGDKRGVSPWKLKHLLKTHCGRVETL